MGHDFANMVALFVEVLTLHFVVCGLLATSTGREIVYQTRSYLGMQRAGEP